MLKGVLSENGFCRLGGATHAGLIDRPNSEPVPGSFFQPEQRVAAGFVRVLVAAHPLALTEVTPAKEKIDG